MRTFLRPFNQGVIAWSFRLMLYILVPNFFFYSKALPKLGLILKVWDLVIVKVLKSTSGMMAKASWNDFC